MAIIQRETATSVYRYYDSYGVLIYVGITARGSVRNVEHNLSKPWWPYVAQQAVDHFGSRDLARVREVELIESHWPPFNVQHNPKHPEMLDAYLSVASKIERAPGEDPSRLVTGLDGKLPLVVLPDLTREGQIAFRTHAEHACIATQLRLQGQPKLSAPGGGTPFGHVTGVQPRGPFAVVIAVLRRDLEAVSARASVKQVLSKGPTVFNLKSVVVELVVS